METQAIPTPKPVTPDFIPTSVFQPFIFSFLAAIKQNPAQKKAPLERKNRVCSIVKEYDTSGFIAGGIACGMQLDYFGARYYDPEVGVWISVDPAGQDFNKYGYCAGNPILIVDKDGRWWWLVGMVAGAYIGGSIQNQNMNPFEWKKWEGAAIGGAIGFTLGLGVDLYKYYNPTTDPALNDMNFRKDVDNFYKTKIDGAGNPDKYVEHATDVSKNDAGSYSMGDIRDAPYSQPGHTPFNPSSAASGSFHYQQPTPAFPTNGTLEASQADKVMFKAILDNSGGDYNYISNLTSVSRYYADGTSTIFNNLNAIRNTNVLNSFFMW